MALAGELPDFNSRWLGFIEDSKMTYLRAMNLAQQFTFIIAIAFLLAAVGGFVPFVTTPPAAMPALIIENNSGYLLGLFPVNIVHNLFHLSISLAAFYAFRQPKTALLFCRLLAITLGALTIAGLIPVMATLSGWMPVFGHAIWLHGLEALIAAYLGFIHKL
jgi:hypothetical protein